MMPELKFGNANEHVTHVTNIDIDFMCQINQFGSVLELINQTTQMP